MSEQLELFPDYPHTMLDQAKAIIYGDRENTYGRPDKNLKCIAAMWSAYLANRLNLRALPTDLTVDDVCWMMALLKASRAANSHDHRDNLVDAVGYLALADRCNGVFK